MLRIINANQVKGHWNSITIPLARFKSARRAVEETIVLPRPIRRGPTDILYALAATVKRDPTAPHFKFIDDPYLIPKSQMAKTNYTLALESGRKAAHFIKNEHPQLFQVSKMTER